MKAVRFSRFGGPEVLEIVDLPVPVPGPGQIRIGVRAAGVNASDWKKRRGLMDQVLPQTLGYEAAGVVAAWVAAGRFMLPQVKTYPLADVVDAHRVGESGRAEGKLVPTVG